VAGGAAVLLASHERDRAGSLAHRALSMAGGQVLLVASPETRESGIDMRSAETAPPEVSPSRAPESAPAGTFPEVAHVA
jgi:hypothetical protein